MSPVNHLTEMPMSLAGPPMFALKGDLQDWRCCVGRWVDIVKRAHNNGSNRHFKTVYKIAGRTLYKRCLLADLQPIVEESQVKRIIDYKQVENPVAAVCKVVKTVAFDPPISFVSKRIPSFHKLTSCRRGKDKDLLLFFFRFLSLAATHPLHSNGSSSSQT